MRANTLGASSLNDVSIGNRSSKRINIAIWTLQILLAALFLFAGGFKLVAPIAELTKQLVLPGWFLRFLGVVEITGALGLILPSLLRIRPYLTPLAAGGLVIVMSGASGISMTGGKIEGALVPFVVGVLAGLVLYARTRVVPIGAKASASEQQVTSSVATLVRRTA
ncbi:MAG TPA: DoxX family protein [Gemmatimonadaceae bacterium]|jgi:hypothetical protein|nr:DoxX family protein [Gemmatimonadaceae bacterium]